MVLPALKVLSGAAKLPPVASAPPIGDRKPVKWMRGGTAGAKNVPSSSVILGWLLALKTTSMRCATGSLIVVGVTLSQAAGERRVFQNFRLNVSVGVPAGK